MLGWSVRTDVSESSKQARDQMLRLLSESMEARMQSLEAFQQLQATMKAIEQLRAGSWPSRRADRLNGQLFCPMVTAESLNLYRAATLPMVARQPEPPDL